MLYSTRHVCVAWCLVRHQGRLNLAIKLILARVGTPAYLTFSFPTLRAESTSLLISFTEAESRDNMNMDDGLLCCYAA
jgi:hypothetical protein